MKHPHSHAAIDLVAEGLIAQTSLNYRPIRDLYVSALGGSQFAAYRAQAEAEWKLAEETNLAVVDRPEAKQRQRVHARSSVRTS